MELASYAQNFADWQKEADFRLLAISIDFPERFPKVKSMTNEKNWPFPVYWDYQRAFKSVLPGELNGLPQVFLFDKNGTLVWHHKRYKAGDEAELFGPLGYIPGATWVPLADVEQIARDVDGSTLVLVVCGDGEQSGAAVLRLMAAGMEWVAALAGGLRAWKDRGYATPDMENISLYRNSDLR